jgi:hypothetical protein
LTGTLTSPKLIAPVHIDLGMELLFRGVGYICSRNYQLTIADDREVAGLYPF